MLALAALGAAATTVGCGGAPRAANRKPRLDRTVITGRQIRDNNFTTALEAVEALRSNWLRPTGPDSFIRPTPVWVYFNEVRLGGVDVLRNIAVLDIVYIRYYDGITASSRWGVGHGQGVIYVSTLPPNGLKFP